MPDSPVQLTIDRVQQIYLAAKDAAEALSKRHAEEMKPLTDRMEATKQWMLKYLNDQGLENAKTEHGLCFKSQVMGVSVEPDGGWENVLRFVMERAVGRVLDAMEQGATEEQAMAIFLEEPALAALNRSVNKTYIKEMLEQEIVVPGVKITHVTQINVRRA